MSGDPSAVLFDLGGVLFDYDPGRRLRHVSEAAGLPEGEVQARLFDTDFDMRCERGELDGPATHMEFCRLLGVDWTYDAVLQALACAFEANGIVFGIARELSSQRQAAALTNNGQMMKEALPRLHPDFGSVFAGGAYFSADLGALKPDPAAFQAVLERWGKQPGDILFVDDSVDNVMAADGLGFHVHRFFDAETLETDLRGFGLL